MLVRALLTVSSPRAPEVSTASQPLSRNSRVRPHLAPRAKACGRPTWKRCARRLLCWPSRTASGTRCRSPSRTTGSSCGAAARLSAVAHLSSGVGPGPRFALSHRRLVAVPNTARLLSERNCSGYGRQPPPAPPDAEWPVAEGREVGPRREVVLPARAGSSIRLADASIHVGSNVGVRLPSLCARRAERLCNICH
jgi:hypothetical protein